MPIQVDSEIVVLSEDEFHQLVSRVLGIVFDLHNDFGRLMIERIYKQALQQRCQQAGIVPASREVEIRACFGSFQKPYYMDLLLANSLMVEAKVVEQLTPAHEAQALNYLLMTGMRHGLLVNMRSASVTKRFLSTSLDLHERRRFNVRDTAWVGVDEASRRVKELFVALLDDWGAFLNTSLYRDALIHFHGGKSVALKRIPIVDGATVVGTQEVFLLTPKTALALTSVKDGKDSMAFHLQRLLKHTQLETFQWINLHNHDVEFRTLTG